MEAALHRVELATKHQSSNFGLGLITVNIVIALLHQPAMDQKKGFFSQILLSLGLFFLVFFFAIFCVVSYFHYIFYMFHHCFSISVSNMLLVKEACTL